MNKLNLLKKISTFVFTMIFVLTLTATANAAITVSHEPDKLTFENNSATMTFKITGFSAGQEFEKVTYAIEHVTGIGFKADNYKYGETILSKVTFTKSINIDSFPITATVWYKENGESKKLQSSCSVTISNSSYSDISPNDPLFNVDESQKYLKVEFAGSVYSNGTPKELTVGRNKFTNVPFHISANGYIISNVEFLLDDESKLYYEVRNGEDTEGKVDREVNCQIRAISDTLKKVNLTVQVNYYDRDEKTNLKKEFSFDCFINPNDSVYDPNYDPNDAQGVYGDPDTLAQVLDINDGIGAIIFDFAQVVAAILTFVCIIMVGVNIIMARGKGEERSSAMQGLMYIAIGLIILDCVFLIYQLIAQGVGDPLNDLNELNHEAIVEEYKL